MPITESSISLNFPDSNHFRFQDCDGYKEIQNNFKEMDVCWYDTINDVLYLIELKDWSDGKLLEEADPSYPAAKLEELKKKITLHRISELVKKSIDSSSMFISSLLGRPYAAKIELCMPFRISKDTEIVLLSVINWTNPDTSYISTINSEYKSRFQSYAKLFGIKSSVVLTKEKAKTIFSWIS
jgi:hypothetical protein